MIGDNLRRRVKKYVEMVKSMKSTMQTGHDFHVTFICRKTKIVSIGVNDYGRFINEQRWGKYVPARPSKISEYRASMHAEIDALQRLRGVSLDGCDIFNIRIDNNGKIARSRPCHNCSRVLSTLNFRKLYYFDGDGNLCVEKKSEVVQLCS